VLERIAGRFDRMSAQRRARQSRALDCGDGIVQHCGHRPRRSFHIIDPDEQH